MAQNYPDQDFLDKQMSFPRVKTAWEAKSDKLQKEAESKGFQWPLSEIYIRIMKFNAKLEIWARNDSSESFHLFRQWDVCELSGILGPKRKEGDEQMPEGFYEIRVFNPQSSFLLSLGLNYPNASDSILSDQEQPGGNIYIHGDCATIGCFPMTDEGIQEIYLLAVLAKSCGQNRIPVHVFPASMDNKSYEMLQYYYRHQEALLQFWKPLKQAWDYFQNTHQIPSVQVDEKGQYILNSSSYH